MIAATVPVEKVFATGCVYGLLGDPRYQAEAKSVLALAPFRDLDPVEAGELLLRLASSSLRKEMYPFTLGWINANPKASHETLTASLDAFNDWPHRFYTTLSKDDNRYGQIDRPRVRSLVKAIESWLEGRRVEGRGAVIAKAIEAYRTGCTTFPIQPPFIDLKSP